MKKVLFILLVLPLACLWFKDPSIRVPDSDVTFDYVVRYSGSGSRGDTLPMLVALHGNGDTAANFYTTALDRLDGPARIVLIQGPLSFAGGNAWPWTAEGSAKYGRTLSLAVELLALKYPTRGKPVLLGFSAGGTMAYYLAARYGNYYSSVFPVSGQLSHEILGDDSFHTEADVLAFHGRSDEIISIEGGRTAATILKAKGARVTLTEFDGGHHGIFTTMKADITQAVQKKLESLNEHDR